MGKVNEPSFGLIHGDCLSVLCGMPDNTIDLVVTSPPYDNLRAYNGVIENWNFDKFCLIAQQLYRVVKKGGVVVWVINDATINGSESGTSFRQALYFKDIGFNIHDTMIWLKQTSTDTGSLRCRYGSIFEYMFVLSKGRPKTFNPIKDRLNKSYGDKKHGSLRLSDGRTKPVSSKGKKIPLYGQRWNVWKINTASYNRTKHPATFPLQLAIDHILSWSNENDTVLDPFMGSGTTGIACANTNRNFIGIEINEEYFAIAKKRIKETQNPLKLI